MSINNRGPEIRKDPCEADSTCPNRATGYTAEHPIAGRLRVCDNHPNTYPVAYPDDMLPDHFPDTVTDEYDPDFDEEGYFNG